MKRPLENLRLDYEYSRDSLYASLLAFFAVVIAPSTTENQGMRLVLYAAMVVVGAIVIYTAATQARRYRVLRNSKL
jgi:hypothetical protein